MKTVKDRTSCSAVQSPSLEVIKTQLNNLVWINLQIPICEQEAGPGDSPSKVPYILSKPGILLDPPCWQLLPGRVQVSHRSCVITPYCSRCHRYATVSPTALDKHGHKMEERPRSPTAVIGIWTNVLKITLAFLDKEGTLILSSSK